MKRALIAALFIHGFAFFANAQEDSLMNALIAGAPKTKDYTVATFKTTKNVNFQTVETAGKGNLVFWITHHFGDISSGPYGFWGLDGPAVIRLGLEYSPDGRLDVGVGRSSLDKLYDGYLKYKILRQTTDNKMPVTMTAFASMSIITLNDPLALTNPTLDHYYYYSDRFNFVYQLMIARKFNSRFSLQLSPTIIHYNLVENFTDQNNVYSLIGLARYKITQSMALTAEYALRPISYTADMSQYRNSAGVGFDIETGDHVFQIFVTNSAGLSETQNIAYSTNSWAKGQLMIGFNICRYFSLKK